jgi:hypothetical protein
MHRWLLLSYPRDHRRERGAEILETARDVAAGGRGPAVAANLVCHGLRARLGRSASRSVVAWATLFTVACGLFAASFGTWLTWLGSRPLDHRELAAAVGELYPAEPATHHGSDPAAPFVFYGSPLTWSAAPALLTGDGAEYSLATIGASLARLPADSRPQALADLQQRLRAAGWAPSGPVHTPAYECVPGDARCDPSGIPTDITVHGARGDDILEIHINADGTTPVMDIAMSRATPASAYPAGAAAFLLGAAAAWCLFGWASRRTAHGHPLTGATTKLLYGAAMVLWWAPILVSAPLLLSHHLGEPHPRPHPLWEWLGQPLLSLPFLLGALMLVLVPGLALLPYRGRGAAERPLRSG